MALTREELKQNKNNVMTIMENRIIVMTGCSRLTAKLVANEILDLDKESEILLAEEEPKREFIHYESPLEELRECELLYEDDM